MALLADPQPVMQEATFDVYIKRVRSGTPPEAGVLDSASASGGEEGEWQLDTELRLRDVNFGKWPQSSTARFDFVSASGTFRSIEDTLKDYWVDDQVRVIMQPPPGSSGGGADVDSDSGEDSGVVVFEGTMPRQQFAARAVGDRDDEDTSVVAIGAPSIDNLSPEHTIRGRWLQDPAEAQGTPWMIDSPAVPAVFNAGGSPNRAASSTYAVHDGDLTIQPDLFSYDNDFRASYWTPRTALLTLVGYWLYGPTSGGAAALKRSVCLEHTTYQILTGATTGDERGEGMNDTLPEVSVQGLHVFDAMNRVCSASGFEMAILPNLGRARDENAVAADRVYELKIWRSGAGPDNELRLSDRIAAKAGDDPSTAQLLAENNVQSLNGMRDATKVRNHVIATGPVLVEVSVPLKPMWKLADVDATTPVTAQHQQEISGQAGITYQQRHVANGKQNKDYIHVGRLWGIDCTGQFEDESLGYGSGDALYHHGDDGFDWLDYLDVDGTDGMSLARDAANVTDDIKWTKRPRKALPLTRPGTGQLTRPYVLEVSEDGGSSWTRIDLKYSVLSDQFAIMLDVPNLANVNKDTITEDRGTPDPTLSWWALILTKQLQFRLTCLIEADHALRHDAAPLAGAGTLHAKAQLVTTRTRQVWQSPTSVVGTGSWAELDDGGLGTSTAGADKAAVITDLAERVRDAASPMRMSLAGSTFIMDPSAFAVGDRITRIAGRNIPLSLSAPGASSLVQRYPSIVSMKIVGYGGPNGGQGVSFDLADEAMRRGVSRKGL